MKPILAIAIACLLLLPACNTLRGAWLEWYRHQGQEAYVEVPIIRLDW